jgi:hypothetical protein
MNWFSKEIIGWRNLVKTLAMFVTVQIFYYAGLLFVYIAFGWQISPLQVEQVSYAFYFPTPLFMLWVAVKEEVMYRLPIAVLMEMRIPYWVIIPVILFIQLYFGFKHGSIEHILFQGVGGIMLCVLFLKCGGMQRKYGKALMSVVLAHYILKIILLLSSVYLGEIS